ncbi:MAG TPA: patatin-like phospholipase family protein [Anaerolineae bacterium]|nr:patatin-like phospholipase family protein [Anaerolineae bacterium]
MRLQDGKIALVLAGGGLAGAVYEIGALRAIDDLLVDRTVNDLDIYVGTSAGALVASCLANGLSPEAILHAIDGSHPEIRALERWHVFRFNNREFLRRTLDLPRILLGAWSHYLRHLDDMNLLDLAMSLTEALPSGLYDVLALERYMRRMLSAAGLSNSFRDLERDLYIIATDLDTGKRAVFGPDEGSDVPISRAAAASAAVPLLYKPVRIGDKEYVDGGLRGNASLDLAIEQGAKLVICINPLVPYDNSDRECIPFFGPDGGYLSEKGAQFIASQVMRVVTHSSLHYHVKQLRRQHPDVDIILIEPRPDDYKMFFYNIMRYSSRLTVARHGFESITVDLAEDYPRYKKILARHGVPLSRRLVISELAEIYLSDNDPDVIRRILEARPAGCNRQGRSTPVCQLTRALAELDLVLDRMEGA